jgi:hypothetical protein
MTASLPERKKGAGLGRWVRVCYSTDNFLALLEISTSSARKPTNKTWVSAEYLPQYVISTPALPHSRRHHVTTSCVSTRVVPALASIISTPNVPRSRQATPCASTSVLAPALISSASESPDLPTIMDVIDLVSQSRKLAKIGVQNSGEVLEITDSESEIEIVHSPHQRVRSFSPEYIVISD